MNRRFWMLVHRYVGLSLALFLAVAGLTGAIIAFYPELDTALNPSVFKVTPSSSPRLTWQQLADAVTQRTGAPVESIVVPTDSERSVRVRVGDIVDPLTGDRKDPGFSEAYVQPYDGRLLGTREWGAWRPDTLHLMPFVYKLHYTLHIPGRWGEWLFGIVAVVWMFDCFVGAYLTFPRARPFLSKWKPAWGIQRRRFNYDMHRALGLWLWLVLFSQALTGVYFNLHTEVFRPVVSVFGTLTPDPAAQIPKLATPNRMPALTFDEALAAASRQRPPEAQALEPRYLRYDAARGLYRIGFAAPGKNERPLAIDEHTVVIDAQTGALVGATGTVTGTGADYFMALQYPLHSGRILGLGGRILVCLAGLATCVLSITGLVIWHRKTRPASRSTAAASAVPAM